MKLSLHEFLFVKATAPGLSHKGAGGGQDFVSAVETLCGGCASPFLSQPVNLPPPKPFELPEPNRYATRVMGYLQGRGIDGGIISRCLRDGSLYESFRYHNCVFVGRGREGKARFACLRGTLGDFKMDVPGSDKRFNFCLDNDGAGKSGTEKLMETLRSDRELAGRIETLRKAAPPERYGKDYNQHLLGVIAEMKARRRGKSFER